MPSSVQLIPLTTMFIFFRMTSLAVELGSGLASMCAFVRLALSSHPSTTVTPPSSHHPIVLTCGACTQPSAYFCDYFQNGCLLLFIINCWLSRNLWDIGFLRVAGKKTKDGEDQGWKDRFHLCIFLNGEQTMSLQPNTA